MLRSRAMATFALDTGELGSSRFAGEASRQSETDSVAGQARGIRLAALGREKPIGEGTRMGGLHHRGVSVRVALRASLRTGVLR